MRNAYSREKLKTITAISVFLILSCSDPVSEKVRTVRDFSWSPQTISYPGSNQTWMFDIWGSSNSNVYAVGHCATSAAGTMYLFNGTQWQTTGYHAAEGGPINGAVILWAIDGTSQTNVVAAGARMATNPIPPPTFVEFPLVIRFDGNTWTELPINDTLSIRDVDAVSESEVWVCGTSHVIYRHDGFTWQSDSLPIVLPQQRAVSFNCIVRHSSGDVYTIGWVNDLNSSIVTYYILRKQNNVWSVIDSSNLRTSWGESALWIGPSGVIYSVGGGVFKRGANSWTNIYDSPVLLKGIAGNSDENIIVGGFTEARHFNGIDWFRIPALISDSIDYEGIWMNGENVFVVGTTNSASIVFRGN